jgi:Ni/Co efflux regulator RcnB
MTRVGRFLLCILAAALVAIPFAPSSAAAQQPHHPRAEWHRSWHHRHHARAFARRSWHEHRAWRMEHRRWMMEGRWRHSGRIRHRPHGFDGYI